MIRQAQARVEGQLRALSADEPAAGEPERVRTQAEWLLALSSQITQGASRPGAQEGFSLQDGWAAVTRASNGQLQLIVPSEVEGELAVPLDPKRSPVEQAERMFDRAAKLERAARFIPKRRASLEADRPYLQQLESDLSLAQNQPEIVAVREALREAGFLRQRPSRREKTPVDRSQPLRFLAPEGFPILVGRNARQNEIVTFKEAARDDLWLHVRDGPGAHGRRPLRRSTDVGTDAHSCRPACRLVLKATGQRRRCGRCDAAAFCHAHGGRTSRPGALPQRGDDQRGG